jgi:hypothetical protein
MTLRAATDLPEAGREPRRPVCVWPAGFRMNQESGNDEARTRDLLRDRPALQVFNVGWPISSG